MRAAAKAWLALFDNYAKPTAAAVRAKREPAVIDAQDEWGMSAAMLCVAYGWPDLLAVVLAGEPDLELRYRRTGETALHLAAQNRDKASAKLLVDAGANPDAGNRAGVTPRELAPALFPKRRPRKRSRQATKS